MAVLMFGGIETTEGMIANAVLHLLNHPDQLALIGAQPEPDGLVGEGWRIALPVQAGTAVIIRQHNPQRGLRRSSSHAATR